MGETAFLYLTWKRATSAYISGTACFITRMHSIRDRSAGMRNRLELLLEPLPSLSLGFVAFPVNLGLEQRNYLLDDSLAVFGLQLISHGRKPGMGIENELASCLLSGHTQFLCLTGSLS